MHWATVREFGFLAKLPHSIVNINGADVVDQYILIVNNHDGKGSSQGILDTYLRVVCANTLTMALQGRQGGYNIRHTSKMLVKRLRKPRRF